MARLDGLRIINAMFPSEVDEFGREIKKEREEHWTVRFCEMKTGEVIKDPFERKIASDLGYEMERTIDEEILRDLGAFK